MEKDVSVIFQVLLYDIESYNNGRESFEINYHLLGKGDLHETRFVLGKIILETMSGGVVKGGRNAVKEGRTQLQPDVSEENGDLVLSDLVKDAFEDRNHKRSLSTSNPEVKQEMVKKQKVVKKSSLSKLEGAIMNSGVVEKVKLQKMTEKHHKIIETCQLPQEETKVIQGIVSGKEDDHLQEQDVTLEMQEDVENDMCKDNAKRHLKPQKNAKHLLSRYEVIKKHLKNCNFSQETKLKHRKVSETKELHFSPQEVVKVMQGIVSGKEDDHLQEQDVTMEMQEDVENDTCKDNAKRHLKPQKNAKHLLSRYEVIEKPLKKCNFSQEAKLKHRKVSETKELHFSPQEVVKEKHDKVLVKEKGSRPLLSSFFK
jgi:hypothetical protein